MVLAKVGSPKRSLYLYHLLSLEVPKKKTNGFIYFLLPLLSALCSSHESSFSIAYLWWFLSFLQDIKATRKLELFLMQQSQPCCFSAIKNLEGSAWGRITLKHFWCLFLLDLATCSAAFSTGICVSAAHS